MQRHLRWLVTAVAVLGMAGSALAGPIVVHTSDFIPDATRTFFNSFEAIPTVGGSYPGGNTPYTEDGIVVAQINGRNNAYSIAIAYGVGERDGIRTWYPNGGDWGYTSIQLACGADFGNVGLLIGSGNYSHTTAYYELWNDGVLLLAGSVAHQVPFHYLGFEGGGFDTILLRDGPAGRLFHDGTHNALALDAIEMAPLREPEPVSAPEPSSLALLGVGLVGMVAVARRRAG